MDAPCRDDPTERRSDGSRKGAMRDRRAARKKRINGPRGVGLCGFFMRRAALRHSVFTRFGSRLRRVHSGRSLSHRERLLARPCRDAPSRNPRTAAQPVAATTLPPVRGKAAAQHARPPRVHPHHRDRVGGNSRGLRLGFRRIAGARPRRRPGGSRHCPFLARVELLIGAVTLCAVLLGKPAREDRPGRTEAGHAPADETRHRSPP